MRHAEGHLIIKREEGFFTLGALSDLRRVPALDNFKSCIYATQTHVTKRNYPASQSQAPNEKTFTYYCVVDSLTFSNAQ